MKNQGKKTGRWALVVLVAASCAWACGDDDDGPSSGTAGNGGTAGEGGTGAIAGEGGTGAIAGEGGTGATAGEGGTAGGGPFGECQSDVCDRSIGRFVDCPDSLEQLNPTCLREVIYQRYDSDCGGTIIEAADGIQTTRFTFDANGALVGHTWAGDTGDGACWGEPCQAVGRPTETLDVCAGGAGGGGAGGVGN